MIKDQYFRRAIANRCVHRTVCSRIPSSAQGCRGPKLRAPDWVRLQVLSLYAARIDGAWPDLQTERLYHCREADGHIAKTGKQSGLMILEAFPLSVLFETSFTSTQSPQPGTQNGTFQFPQDASLFLAGAWSQHVGSFVQVTYHTSDDHFSWDNTDIRYANSTKLFQKDFVYGITLNNNPTVEDLWNSTPAWGYPWILSSAAPLPTAAAIINGRLAQDVAGIGGYGMWNNHLYLAGAIYRSQHLGAPQPNTGPTPRSRSRLTSAGSRPIGASPGNKPRKITI